MYFSCGRLAPNGESLSIFNISGIGCVCHISFSVLTVCSVVCPPILFTIPIFSGRMYLHERKVNSIIRAFEILWTDKIDAHHTFARVWSAHIPGKGKLKYNTACFIPLEWACSLARWSARLITVRSCVRIAAGPFYLMPTKKFCIRQWAEGLPGHQICP